MAQKGHNGPSGNYMALFQNDADMIRRWEAYYGRRRHRSSGGGIVESRRFIEVRKVVCEPPYNPMPYDIFMAARIADYEIGQ